MQILAPRSCGEAVDLEHREHECHAVAGAALLGVGGPRHVAVQPAALVLGVEVLADEGARARGLRVAAVLDGVLEVGHLCVHDGKVGPW